MILCFDIKQIKNLITILLKNKDDIAFQRKSDHYNSRLIKPTCGTKNLTNGKRKNNLFKIEISGI